jgi:hypothetical protein
MTIARSLARPYQRHGQTTEGSWSSEYRAWKAARHRTTNSNHPYWDRYGGRGIVMAPEWFYDFSAFLAHIGPKPSPELTLDRIDNDKGYEPGNVRWATRQEQAQNRRARRSK